MTVEKRKLDELEADKIEESVQEERVLSHAAQRRLRKRLKTSHGDEPPKKTPSKPSHSSADKLKVQIHTIWVGNLAFKTTPQDLRVFFADVSEDIKRIHMPTKALHGSHSVRNGKVQGGNKGCVYLYHIGIWSNCDEFYSFAYVDFSTLEEKQAAIAKSESHLDGRRLLIKDGNDFAGRPEKDGQQNPSAAPLTGLTKTARKILSQQKNDPCPTLFVGNLGFETTEEDIRCLFTRVQNKSATPNTDDSPDKQRLTKIRMGTFEDSGKCKGFAFLDFEETRYATEALTNPRNHSLNGRALVVEYASADAVRRGNIRREREAVGTTKSRQSRRPQKSERIAAKAAARKVILETATTTRDEAEDAEQARVSEHSQERSSLPQKNARRQSAGKSKTARLKSGAALANAQREKVAIVEHTGRKIVFS
ncbi:hypothetical protein CPB86DRAFT_816357 [Serendipita vermifera]|nr:hypothetical protein CPB86DRAFT_816357 [Serendipita vermifera]